MEESRKSTPVFILRTQLSSAAMEYSDRQIASKEALELANRVGTVQILQVVGYAIPGEQPPTPPRGPARLVQV